MPGITSRATSAKARGALGCTALFVAIFAQLFALHWEPVGAASIDQSRALFMRAQSAIDKGRMAQARRLISKLQHYPLTGYLELSLAKQQLPSSSHEAVAHVMGRHGKLPIAFMLRRPWLEKLAHDGRWTLLLEQQRTNDDPGSACRVAQAKWQLGDHEHAWLDAQQLWLTGRSLPDSCDALIAAWHAAGKLSDALVWQRIKLAMANRKIKLALFLRRYAGKRYAALIDRWLSLRGDPSRLPSFVKATDVANVDMASVVIDVFSRTAKRDVSMARTILEQLSVNRLPSAVLVVLRDRLSRSLVNKHEPDAAQWLKYATSPESLRVHAVDALHAGNSKVLLKAIEAMAAEQAQRERWRYWGAHSLAALGRNDEAEKALRLLAEERSYYGFLAADKVRQPYVLGHRAMVASVTRLALLGDDQRVVRTKEWLALGQSSGARREWLALLDSLDTHSKRDAAVLAGRWSWHEGAIRAAAKAAAWDDLDIRFPLAHRKDVDSAALRSQLQASRIYAVARQESAFMQDIRSSAGALGLMQLMPATARQVARAAGQRKPNRAAILEPSNNLLLGSLYLARLQKLYGGHAVLATAAYNAGPGRVRSWRRIPRAVDSQAWIEAIPFKETRRYVRSVLTYQIIYAARLGEKTLRLRDLMPAVKPRRK